MPRSSAITSPASAGHDDPGHPENNGRLLLALSGVPAGTPVYEAGPAPENTVHRIHSLQYTAWLREQCTEATGPRYLDSDTYVTRESYAAALHAAGAAILATDRARDGEHAFALVRPPGHHAERDRAMGFCLLNNAAIAAAHALDSTDRVAIVDWDVHHGNGTEHAFYRSDRVLYCSVHQAQLFPYSGSPGEIGTGPGTGYTVNAPLPAGSGGADYRAVFREIFVPALERFRPGTVIVSAGQDILGDDPLGGMNLRPRDIGMLTGLLADATDVPLALVLEGGYGPSHGEAVAAVFSALSGKTRDAEEGLPQPDTLALIAALKQHHPLFRT